MKRGLLFTAIAAVGMFLCQSAFAQVIQAPVLPPLRSPRISQGQSLTQVVGMSEVNIYYHRPGVKGRTIWGPKGSNALLPYGEVWRAGANEPTLFTFTDEVTIGGKKLRPGTYRFVTIPGTNEWTVVFNSEVKNWGTVYDAKYDTLRLTVKPENGPHEEWMSFSFTDLSHTSATVVLAWEKVRISFKVEFNLLAKLQASVGTWGTLNGAARTALDNKMYLKEAMGWVDRSLAIERNFFNLKTKAELLALEGKTSEAIAAAEEGLKIISPRVAQLPDFQRQQVTDMEKMVADWKKK